MNNSDKRVGLKSSDNDIQKGVDVNADMMEVLKKCMKRDPDVVLGEARSGLSIEAHMRELSKVCMRSESDTISFGSVR